MKGECEMCLPSIVDVAHEQGIEINPRSLNKKEVYAKCPFCLGDSNINGKFKLSLNQEYNVFKCWLCKTSGGVLEFESRLTGKSFNEVKTNYFGQSKKKRHYVEYLSPIQLRKIGWNDYKRQHREEFMNKKDEVLRDWQNYEYDEMVKHFALLMVVSHIENAKERQATLLEYVYESAKKTGIYSLFTKLIEEYTKMDDERSKWALEGVDIARAAWKTSLQTYDFEMDNVVKHVLFIYYLNKSEMKNINPKVEKEIV